MKTLASILLLVVPSLVIQAQDKFIYNQEGLKPSYLVVEIEGKTQDELFQKAINWIKETYKNPDKVIKTTIDKEKVRFEGFQDNLICIQSLGIPYCYGATYTIEISFKDGKYKFEPLSMSYYVPASQYSRGGDVSVSFSDGTNFYNNKGTLKPMNSKIPSAIEGLFNDLNSSLLTYINKKEGSSEKKDDW